MKITLQKLFASIAIVLLANANFFAQNVGINTTGAAPAASAMLDIVSTSSGLLIPRMSSAQRTAIGAPATGLLVYDTTTNSFWYYNGAIWIQILNTNTGWSTTGNAGTSVATNFWGTTDNNALAIRTNNTERIRILNTGETGFNGIPAAPSAIAGFIPNCMYYPFEVGNDGNSGAQVTIGYYRGSDPTVNPEQLGGWGYVGYNAAGAGNNQYWWRGYSGGWINVSQRELKRDIITLKDNSNIESYLISNILNMKPSLYNYKNEYSSFIEGKENHYRPAYRIGLIADESPDYILDESFSGVDIYGLATLSLVGAQYSIKEINKIKKTINISDFGTGEIKQGTNTMWIKFTENFKGQTPVVTVTSNNPDVTLSVIEKNDKGFKVSISQPTKAKTAFDWIAMAKTISDEKEIKVIDSNIKEKLEIPSQTKSTILDFYSNLKPAIGIKK